MKKFEWKPFLKNVAVIAVPVALQNLLTTTGSMVDTIMLAPLGQNTVGAVGLCAQLTSLLFSCYWGFVGGGMLFFAQYFGAKDDDGINRSYGMTLTCMMTVGIVFAAAALLFPEAVMRVYTDKTSIQEIGVRYLRVVGFAYPLQVLSMAMSALLRSTGKVRIPLFGAIASVCTNIALNWVLIYGHLGLPAMGIQGAALATAIAWGIFNSLAAQTAISRILFAMSRDGNLPKALAKVHRKYQTWCWAASPRRPSPPQRCSARWRASSSASSPAFPTPRRCWWAHRWARAIWRRPTSAPSGWSISAAASS